MSVRRRLSPAAIAASVAVAVGLGIAAPAQADLAWKACAQPQGYQCARASVAIDRTGAFPGALSLNVVRGPAASNPERSAVIALAGGPGQAAAPLAADFAAGLAPALATRDLVVFDQRGTGQSNPLSCGAFSKTSFDSITQIASQCATQIGAGRRFFTTADSVQDIEDLRIQIGYDKLVLYGVSYGTKVAEAYAAAYPQRVERLVLDSVVTPEGPDPLQRSTFASVKRVLGDLCANRACSGITSAPTADLRKIVRQLQKRDLRGQFVAPNGKIRSGTFSRDDLLSVLVAGDLNPTLRADLPAALRSAARGDRWLLTRLVARLGGLTASQAADEGVNSALYASTVCEELPFPWARDADATTRGGQLKAALNGLSPNLFLPFDRSTAAASTLVGLCQGWPNAGPAPAVNGNLPAVPTLIINGKADLRTPLEDAQSVGSRIPGSQTVGVPFTGHSVLGSELSQEACAETALKTFFAGGPVAQCTETVNPLDLSPMAARQVSSLRSVRGSSGRLGRTLRAVLLAADDVRSQIRGWVFENGECPRRVGGLRSGSTVIETSGTQRLRAVQFVRGVKVSGRVAKGPSAVPCLGTSMRLTVRGGGALSGTVNLSSNGRVLSGRLGGRKYRLVAANSASLRTSEPSAEALVRGWKLRQAG
ncbi:MAG: alpha/beta fold hydrolase [Solirubrobacteraceae bacterium]|nr:alpha/beta fold hydrolase [Solirubrobacteraceae bacterium]